MISKNLQQFMVKQAEGGPWFDAPSTFTVEPDYGAAYWADRAANPTVSDLKKELKAAKQEMRAANKDYKFGLKHHIKPDGTLSEAITDKSNRLNRATQAYNEARTNYRAAIAPKPTTTSRPSGWLGPGYQKNIVDFMTGIGQPTLFGDDAYIRMSIPGQAKSPNTRIVDTAPNPTGRPGGAVPRAGAAAAIAALPETLPAAWRGMKGIWKSRPEWMGGQGAGDLMQPYGQGWQSKGQFSDGTAAAYGDLGIDLALQGGNIAKGLGDFVADFVPWRAGGGGLFGTGYDPSIPIRHGANIVVGPSLRQFGGVDTSSLEGAIGAPEGGQHHLLGDWQVPTDPDTAPAIRKAITSLAPLAEAQRKQQFDAVNAGGSGGASRWR